MRRAVLTILLILFAGTAAHGEFRFPMPDFSTDYTHPSLQLPAPEETPPLLDISILTLTLLVASLLVLKRRSRREIFLLTLFSLLYFGFIRQGCICPVGSLQNIAAGIFHSDFGVPLVVLAFFSIPLIFALFCGRVFCAAVCPLGAIQEAVAARPVKIPLPAERLLGLIPYIYLGLTVLSVAMGAGFIICQYDPFVGFFRLSASFNMLIFGGAMLVIGIFVARPYCRFLCPYGVLLNWMSRLAKWHATITPSDCVQCTLCADSCPYNAINTPAKPEPKETGIKRLKTLLVLLPVLIAIGAAAGTALREPLSRLHPTVRLAERIAGEEIGVHTEQTIDSETFRASEETDAQLYDETLILKKGFASGGAWLGAFIGLVLGCKLIALALGRKRADYEPDRGACLSCGRCFQYCPVPPESSKQRKKEFDPHPLPWRAANAVALVAAILALIVCVLLIADYVRIRKIDPVNQPQLEVLREDLAASTGNDEELISQIRAFDLMARRTLFDSQDQRRTGGWLLLGSTVVLFLSLKLAALLNPKLPHPRTETQSEQEVNAHLRQLLAGAGIFLVVISLFFAFTVQSDLTQLMRRETRNIPANSQSETDIPKRLTWSAMQTNWPSFRGPGGYGAAHFASAPTNWNIETSEGVLWETSLPKQGYNSPVVWGKRLFLSGTDKDGESVYCFNADTGKLLWHHMAEHFQEPPAKRPTVTEDTGYAAATMATDGQHIFAIFGTGVLVCHDFDGQLIWGKSIGIPKNPYGHSSSLIVGGNLLYVQFDQEEDGKLLAFDTSTGELAWQVARKNISWSSPALIQSEFGPQLILNSLEDVDAYDPTSGKLLWTVKCLGGEVAPSPAYANGIIYAANEYAQATALKLLPGKAEILWEYNEHLPEISSPLATKEHLFIISSAGDAVCLDAATAEELWVHEFYREFKSSPILVGDRIYLADLEGTIWIFRAGPEYRLINSIEMGEPIFATPAFMDGRIYIKTETKLYCIVP